MENYHSSTSPIIPPLQHQILINGQGSMPSKPKHSVLHTDAAGEVTLVYTFSEEEYRKGISAPKNRKVAGTDNVLAKQLNNIGPTLHNWLQNQRRQRLITTMPPYQIRTTHNTLVQLHQHKSHGFVYGSHEGGDVHSHITTEQPVFRRILKTQKLLHLFYGTKRPNNR